MMFKYVLILSLSIFFLYVLLLPRQAAIRKLFLLGIVSIMIIFSFLPDLSTDIANFFGIGRGADFLFYISHIVLFFIAFLYYLHSKEMEEKWTKLIRHLAITEAKTQREKK